MIMLQYHLLHNRMQTNTLSDEINSVTPVIKEYNSVRNQIREKLSEKKELNARKNNTSIFSPLQHIHLNQRLTTITEDMEELKSRKTQLMYKISCQNEKEMNEAETILSQMNTQLGKLEAQHDSLEKQISDDVLHFENVKSQADPAQNITLLDARLAIWNGCIDKLLSKLHDVFGQKFDFQRFRTAANQVDNKLAEDPDIFQERALYLQQEQEQTICKNPPANSKKKIRTYER